MGLVLKLLTLPVSGPIGATVWIAEQIRAAGEGERDESAIRRELAALHQQYDSGKLSQIEYEEAADMLFERLLLADAVVNAGEKDHGRPNEEPDHA